MSVRAGARFGRYEIEFPIGAGGMGELYRARDPQLGRTVALKLLRREADADPSLLDRFEREARAVARLHHPHICALFDVGREQGVPYLVMEYLEGETLAQRLARVAPAARTSGDSSRGLRLRGAIPVEQAIDIAVALAQALDHAHRRGIVHRDVKPSNVMLTASGVKLLDFGLATRPGPNEGAAPAQPDAAVPGLDITGEGTVVGTLPYIAPEQLQGRGADARSDLFALAVVVYEMLAGRPPFAGETEASVVAAILGDDPPPLASQRPGLPASIDRLVTECLAKDPDARWQSAADVARQLQWARHGIPAVPARPRRWAGAALAFVVGCASVGLVVWRPWHKTLVAPPPPAFRYQVALPFGQSTSYLALSPDGRRLAFVGPAAQSTALWIRSLETGEQRAVPGTEGAQQAFWSPDAKQVAFDVPPGRLMRVPPEGGPPEAIASFAGTFRGGSWGADDVVIFASSSSGSPSKMFTVPARGGRAREWLPAQTTASRFGPRFFPDGRRFLFVQDDADHGRSVCMGSLSGDVSPPLFATDSPAQVIVPGYVAYARHGALLVRRFDPASGPNVDAVQTLAARIGGNPFWGFAAFSTNGQGVLAMREAIDGTNRLAWRARDGRVLATRALSGSVASAALAHDGHRALALAHPAGRATAVAELVDDEHEGGTTVVGNADRDLLSATWSPTGDAFAYSFRGGVDVRVRSLGREDERVLARFDKNTPELHDWSPDGKWLAMVLSDWGANRRAVLVSVVEPRRTLPISRDLDDVGGIRFSRDGALIAFAGRPSAATGQDRWDVYVSPVPPNGERRLVIRGGTDPRWSADGRELLFVAVDGTLSAVTVTNPSPQEFAVAAPKPLFALPRMPDGAHLYDGDGERFVVIEPVKPTSLTYPVTFVVNWHP